MFYSEDQHLTGMHCPKFRIMRMELERNKNPKCLPFPLLHKGKVFIGVMLNVSFMDHISDVAGGILPRCSKKHVSPE